jgi:tetratricopeptide (TPR) repeat protein
MRWQHETRNHSKPPKRGQLLPRRGKTSIDERRIAMKPEKLDTAEDYIKRAHGHVYENDYDSAMEDCTQAIQLDPDNPEYYFARAYVHGRKNDFDSAIADCSQAIALKPNMAGYYRERHFYYLKKGSLDSAIEDCTKAIALDPDFGNLFGRRGEAYLEKKEFDNAISDFSKALELGPYGTPWSLIYYPEKAAKGYFPNPLLILPPRSDPDPNWHRRDLWKAYLCRAEANKAKGDMEKASADFAKAKELGYDKE